MANQSRIILWNISFTSRFVSASWYFGSVPSGISLYFHKKALLSNRSPAKDSKLPAHFHSIDCTQSVHQFLTRYTLHIIISQISLWYCGFLHALISRPDYLHSCSPNKLCTAVNQDSSILTMDYRYPYVFQNKSIIPSFHFILFTFKSTFL